MGRKGLKPATWCAAADLDNSVLRKFLSGENDSLTLSSLSALAQAASVSIGEMLGERPPRVGAVERKILRRAVARLESALADADAELNAEDSAMAILGIYDWYEAPVDETVAEAAVDNVISLVLRTSRPKRGRQGNRVQDQVARHQSGEDD